VHSPIPDIDALFQIEVGLIVRVLIVSEGFHACKGGLAASTRRIATHLARTHVTTHVAILDSSPSPGLVPYRRDDRTPDGVRITHIGPYFIDVPWPAPGSLKARLRRYAFSQLTSVAGEARPDLLHTLSLLEPGFLGVFLAATSRLPHLASIRGNDLGRNLFRADRMDLVHWVLARADRVAVVNQHLYRLACRAFPDVAWKLQVVPNSVVTGPFPLLTERERSAWRHQWGIDPSHIVVGYVGTIREKKAPEILLRSLAYLRKRSPAVLVVIGEVGSAADGERFSTAAARYGVASAVRLVGPLPPQMIPRAIEALDVFMMPSLDDGMANALLEAMERARAVLVSDVFSDVVAHAREGLVCDPYDPDSFCAGLAALASSAELRARFGQEARRRILRQFTPQREVTDYLRLYRTMTAKASWVEAGADPG
jgi:glycosyltransferase involved in cell wall biosynthesis